jgi:hypothetical protein
MTTELAFYDDMCRAIAAAHSVDEVKDIRDKALAIEIYSRQARNIENGKRAIEIRIRQSGGVASCWLRRRSQRAEGHPKTPHSITGGFKAGQRRDEPKTLTDLGISENQSARWQKLAAVPEDEFEATFAWPEKPSTTGIITAHQSDQPKTDQPKTDQRPKRPVQQKPHFTTHHVARASSLASRARVANAAIWPSAPINGPQPGVSTGSSGCKRPDHSQVADHGQYRAQFDLTH